VCLILLAWKTQARFPLVVAANRDEFHGRPASPAAFWADRPDLLAGRDLEAKGTWMGVTRKGRFAAVTNYRGATEPKAKQSRGALPVGFLTAAVSPGIFMKSIPADAYSGFNLLASDGEELWWMSNRDGTPRRLEPGVYGLGNLLLDSPEIEPDKQRLRRALEPAPALEPLFSTLAPARIVNGQYGTRCSTVLVRNEAGRTQYAERSFGADGADGQTLRYEWQA
jgi:uncharacterized protein with NRDE domain